MNETKNNLLIPGAIIIAGALIAGGIYFSGTREGGAPLPDGGPAPDPKSIEKVGRGDYVLGDPKTATLTIVEYSDLECPFCKTFHDTLHRIVNESNGTVAWVYRHFPLDGLHKKARTEALAAECAGSLGGNSAFWKFIDRVFEVTPSNDGLDLTTLPEIAAFAGVDRQKFSECLSKESFSKKIESQLSDAIEAGGKGTPFSVIITKKGEYIPLEGAYQYEDMKAIVEGIVNAK